MARRIIIGEILNLIKGLGGNPSKFMGTKSNINFLGKGPKEALFQGQIDIDGLVRSGFPIERVIGEAETAGGYATANKLNDIQLQRLKDNLITLKQAYKPEPVANITDMATGTGDLTPGGLEYLKRTGKTGATQTTQNMESLGPGYDDSVLMTRISDRMKNIKGMSDEMGAIGKGEATKDMTYTVIDPAAEKVSYASRFNPKNEVHVEKAKALLEDPQLKGVYNEAEVKNAYDFEGLYQSHFDKGQVDIAQLLEQAGHNVPQMRASARDTLLKLMKAEDALPIAEIDLKYITEGGGGRAGDPINLMAKYFGKNATENLPKNATKENIDAFTDFIMAAKDSRGRGINDPFFERETIDFSDFVRSVDEYVPPFESGGRVNKESGGLAEILQVPRSGYSKGRAVKSLMGLVNKKFGKGTLKRASDLPKGTKYEELEAVKAFEQRHPRVDDLGGSKVDPFSKDFDWRAEMDLMAKTPYTAAELKQLIIKKYKGKVDDRLLQQMLTDDNPQRLAEIMATIDEALLMQAKGMNPEAIMTTLKDSWKRKPSASGGRAGFKFGSRTIAKGAIAFLKKNKKNAEYMFKASDNVSPGYAKGDMKYNAELLADQLAEDAGVVYDDLDDLTRIEFYGTAYDYLAKEMGMMLQMKKLGQVVENKQMLREWNPGKGRKPSASGGLAKILEV